MIDFDTVESIVRKAAELMTGPFDVENKDGVVNIVTSCDLAVQEYLCKELSALLPGCGFICEEENVHDPDKEYVWIIDPIDGTANFARGLEHCAISVALVRNGEILLGIVYSPALGKLFRAEKGRGAYCNGKPVHASPRTFAEAMLCSAMSTYRKQFAPVCADIIMDTYLRCNDIRRYGSAAVELCMMASGYLDLYFEIRLQPWDYAAGILILEEAGGCICDLDGRRPSFDGPDLVCAANSRDNLSELLSTVRRHLPTLPY